MPVVPHDLGDRLRRMYVSDPPDAIEQLRDVLRETVDLIELRVPDLNRRSIEWARYGLELRPRVVVAPTWDGHGAAPELPPAPALSPTSA